MNTAQSTIFSHPAAWAVHAFTASGAVVGLFALESVFEGNHLLAMWLLWLAVGIDGIDGFFARKFRVKETLPQFDGALLDNIIDYLTYVIVPAVILMRSNLLAESWRSVLPAAVVLSSAYQFCHRDAKTTDNFFRGFPSVWNIVVCYMLVLSTSQHTNAIALIIGVTLVFIPIKYVYPSRMEYLTSSVFLRRAMLASTLFWVAALLTMQWLFPETPAWARCTAVGFPLLYLAVSVYRTLRPLS